MTGPRGWTPLRPAEVPREQEESAFTPILRTLWSTVPTLLMAGFVDFEGECVDYVSCIDVYEAKVVAAHMQALLGQVQNSSPLQPFGQTYAIEVVADRRDIWARRVNDEYALVLLLLPDTDAILLRQALGEACRAFREEAGLASPHWDSFVPGLRVAVRPAVAWSYAPVAYWQFDERIDIADVLGHWREDRVDEDSDVGALLCFRVRTQTGHEVTLVHKIPEGRWSLRAT